ncbi:sodium:solute symporter [Puniceicoccales bacterium CK1056]|uniref:Sodium:solute symporter n=1 Tax=Oceanipulchritudo coccoides TaxID=2706888 RepID=A0A6B2M1R1_9BACT|nr:sodium:solute symporter [Oceanipulchritudo coccoides]NDV61725.1 sodium:solute symporter [Oceanipulchritudo coccoides]
MKYKLIFLFVLSLGQGLCHAELKDAFNWSSAQIPDAVVKTGQVGAYTNETLLLAGGFENDGNPSASIYALVSETPGQYKLVSESETDHPIGLCKSTYREDGLYLAGLAGEVSRTVFRITYTEGTIGWEELTAFPKPVAVIGMDFIESLLCVFGMDPETGLNVLYTLDIDSPGLGWVTEEDFQWPVVNDAVVKSNYGMLHIFGASRTGDNSLGRTCYGWRKLPVDGTVQKGWIKLASLPDDFKAATTFTTGQSHIGFFGVGFGDTLSKRTSLLIYHTVTDTWVEADQYPESISAVTAVRIDNSCLFTGNGQSKVPLVGFAPTVSKLKFIDYVVMAIYFLLLAAIGYHFARRQKSSRTFAIGGGKVAWWAAAISMFATGASAISFMAIPSLVFRTNLIWLFPIVVFVPFYFVQAYLLFPLLRKLDIISTYEYLERRFHPSLRLLASLQCIAFQTFGRISVVILLPALAISATTGLDVFVSVLLMGLITTLYTTFGGFEAVVWTDVLQGLLMIGGIGLMIWFGISGMPGGISEFVQVGQQYNKFDFYIGGWNITLALGIFLVIRQLAESFAATADQPMIQRVFSTPLTKVRKFAAMFAFFAILIAVFVQFMGLSMFGFFHANPEKLDPFMTNDQIVPLFVTQTLPAGISGLIIAALFAASMSTLSSSVNSVSTLLSEDFYCKIKKNVTDREKLVVLKISSLVIGLFGTGTALFMASLNIKSMFQLWIEISALIGGGFVGMYFLGMFTNRANSPGAVVGAISSIFALIWIKNYTDVHWSLYQALAIVSCVVVGYLFSLFLPHKERDLTGLTVFKPAK